MGIVALILAIILYLVIGIDNLLKKDYPHSLMWVCYALANVALLWYELQKRGNNEF